MGIKSTIRNKFDDMFTFGFGLKYDSDVIEQAENQFQKDRKDFTPEDRQKFEKILENIKKLKADKKANDLPGNISKTELKQLMKATDLKGGGMVSKKKSKVAGKLALRGYGRALKGKK